MIHWRGQSGSPLFAAYDWGSVGIHVLVLAHDVLSTDIPELSDGVGHHEAPHQFGNPSSSISPC